MKTIFLYGPPASGKTTLGKCLAERLGISFLDLDAEIERTAGMSVAEIFAREGETRFRDRETAALHDAAGRARIVSLGGGTLLRDENRAFCEKTGKVVCLDAPSVEELARRIAAADGVRPLGNRAKERAAHYASFENRIVATFEVGPSVVAVGKGFALDLVEDEPVAVDENFLEVRQQNAMAGTPLPHSPIVVVPSGESHKTLATVALLWHAFAVAGLGRRDRVVSVGGGVTGDLVGFAAATWMRGMDWINVPTTLLSMVDASTGGKTGCDLPEGKNLAGAFHPPRLVLIDTDLLATLPSHELANGRAEMIKHEIIGGENVASPLFGLQPLSSYPNPREVADNLRVKVGIVREDPFEMKGRRMLLNCGHTVAHAVETLTDYRVSHGEAVAIGCVEEAREAVRRGLASPTWPDELAASFAAAGLPTELPEGLNWARMKPVMAGDKKRAGSVVHFALPCGWGDVRDVAIDLGEEAK